MYTIHVFVSSLPFARRGSACPNIDCRVHLLFSSSFYHLCTVDRSGRVEDLHSFHLVSNFMVRLVVFGVWNAKKATASPGTGLGGWAGPQRSFIISLSHLRLCCLTTLFSFFFFFFFFFFLHLLLSCFLCVLVHLCVITALGFWNLSCAAASISLSSS
ncbi:hypothetical protein VTN02DRAFT_3257 [Thermoascus thermophilus]